MRSVVTLLLPVLILVVHPLACFAQPAPGQRTVLQKAKGEIGASVGNEYLFGSTYERTDRFISFRYRLENATSQTVSMEYAAALMYAATLGPGASQPIEIVLPLTGNILNQLKDFEIPFSYGQLPNSQKPDATVRGQQSISVSSAPAYIPRYRAFLVSIQQLPRVSEGVLVELKTILGGVYELISTFDNKKRTITYSAVNKTSTPIFLQWVSASSSTDFKAGQLVRLPPAQRTDIRTVAVPDNANNLYLVNDLAVFNTKSLDDLPGQKLTFAGSTADYSVRRLELDKSIQVPNTAIWAPAFVPQGWLP